LDPPSSSTQSSLRRSRARTSNSGEPLMITHSSPNPSTHTLSITNSFSSSRISSIPLELYSLESFMMTESLTSASVQCSGRWSSTRYTTLICHLLHLTMSSTSSHYVVELCNQILQFGLQPRVIYSNVQVTRFSQSIFEVS
jgi:hypothetical protein